MCCTANITTRLVVSHNNITLIKSHTYESLNIEHFLLLGSGAFLLRWLRNLTACTGHSCAELMLSTLKVFILIPDLNAC